MHTVNESDMQRFTLAPGGVLVNVECALAVTHSLGCEGGTDIFLAPLVGFGSPSQQWEIEDGSGTIRASNGCVDEDRAMVIDVFGRQTQHGADIILYFANDQDNQVWSLEPVN